ncbi:Do family serine endopeptidase [Marinicella sp. W31]|uniref:Do family serine endopeptidase n=1 Tax=Marinicella sp. W31 TaxID=3023713 RepID=UPI00375707A8
MMRKSTVFIFLMFLLLCGAVQAQLPDFTELVEKTGSAVVNIEARKNARTADAQNDQTEDFFRFFGIPGQPNNRDSFSGGTGFIISNDGYILTNRHVIFEADAITVRLKDRRELDAELVGEDEASDVALLKVDADDLPYLKFSSSQNLKIGEWVMAIGSPLSFEHTVTKGIVSAKGRNLRGQQYIPYIQTDVPINRGNSGGPLINMNGEVVGINTLILSSTGGYMGLSFSIPIEIAKSVADQLKANGVVKRGLLGVGIENVNQEMADYLKMKKPRGALINSVSENSAAKKAGLKEQDVIIEFNGYAIVTSGDLPPVVGITMPNTEVKLKVFRDGKAKTMIAVLDELPNGDVTAASSGGASEIDGLGFSVANLTEEEKEQHELDGGVVVKSISDRDVQRAGLRVDDVIKKLGKVEISDVSDFEEAVSEREEGEPLVLLVKQGAANRFIVIE